ncbi:InlB B-repeat-containing protein [Lysinibacillus sp. NPDC097279]|uniref:InlB B-repeat-containing protein n=1 Tax=Lysinibacillus sp. NPDC097279 TaxID=3364143 RepID=UPI00382E4647
MKKIKLWGAIFLLFMSCCVISPGGSVKAAGSPILDQSQMILNGNIFVNKDYPRYQTFTPAVSGNLSKIDVNIAGSYSTTGALIASIYKEDDLSTPVASTQLTSFGSGWTSIDFSNLSPYLIREKMYRMVLSTENGGATAGFGWYGSSNNPYPRGLSSAAGYDFTFNTYMIPDYSISPEESEVFVSNPSLEADGISHTSVTVKLKNVQGNDVLTGGETVTISSTLGTVSAVTDNNDGTYSATLTTSTVIGTATISASIGGRAMAATTSVQFVSGPPSAQNSTIAVTNSSLLADGTSQTMVTVKLKDAQNHEIKAGGAALEMSSTLGTLSAVADHNNGMYTATLTAPTTVGTATIGASVDGQALTAKAIVQFDPMPAQTVSASVELFNPIVGNDNSITISVTNALGNTDTSFNGVKNVIISGYKQAPNGSIGSFDGVPLTPISQTVDLNFLNGVAISKLKLNAATTQSIQLEVTGVSTPTANLLTITPEAGPTATMKLTTDIVPPTINGGTFGQQPVLTLYDVYKNVSVNDSTKIVTVKKKDTGAWTLTGDLNATANAGIVSFSNLGASNSYEVTGAQLAFDATGVASLTSSAVTLLPKQYTVGFDTNGGSAISDITINYQDKLVKPTSPTKIGHTFTGWYKDADFTTEWDFMTDVVAGDTTLYAKWIANSYTITFNSNGGTYVAPDNVAYNGKITKPIIPSKLGYLFGGWHKDTALTEGWDFATDVVTEAITLYAKWTANPTYTVIYDKNGATGGTVPQDSKSYEENENVTVQGNSGLLFRTNYSFKGWNTQADGKGTAYAEKVTFKMGKANVTLYAQWVENPPTTGGGGYPTTPPVTNDQDDSPPAKVKITLYTNGGTVMKPIEITANTKVSDLPVPTKEGYRFYGWYQDEALTKQWHEETIVRVNISLYAKWTPFPVEEPKPPQEPQTPKPIVTFGDLDGHWAKEMVEELSAQGIIQGFDDGTFRPNTPISRMHVAALLTRAFSFEQVRATKVFSDVPSTHPYYEAIGALQKAGIIDGTNGAFRPTENMTRAQLAKVLVGVLGLTPEGTSSFADVASTHWSAGYISVLKREGITLGDNGKFYPNEPVTRAQFVAFLYRALQFQGMTDVVE